MQEEYLLYDPSPCCCYRNTRHDKLLGQLPYICKKKSKCECLLGICFFLQMRECPLL